MFGKLIKHEFRATGRIMLPMFALMALVSVGANFSFRWIDRADAPKIVSTLSGIVIGVFSMGFLAMIIVAFVLMLRRFRTNFFSDEGYLMFTLPVTPHGLIWSKVIVSTVWFVATCAMIAASALIAAFDIGFVNDFVEFVKDLWNFFTSSSNVTFNGTAIAIEAVIILLLGCVSLCLMFYASLSTGYGFANHKILMSFLAYIAFTFIGQVLIVAGFSFMSRITDMSWWRSFTDGLDDLSGWHGVAFTTVICEVIFSAIYYFITVFNIKRRLNLE